MIIFLQGYLYALTQHLLTRKNFLFLNSLAGFWRSLTQISQYFHFVDNSNHLKDLVIHILWTLAMSFSDAQAMILTVILTVYQTQQLQRHHLGTMKHKTSPKKILFE
jgi:hypothetical protein